MNKPTSLVVVAAEFDAIGRCGIRGAGRFPWPPKTLAWSTDNGIGIAQGANGIERPQRTSLAPRMRPLPTKFAWLGSEVSPR